MVGVSGGADSLTLLDVIHHCGFSVVVAHVNHGLRANAGDDAERVREFSFKFQLPFVLGEVDAGVYAQEQHLSVEEAARILRYRFLAQTAQLVGAQALAVGHTADDQVETVLMHQIRGAGLAGLSGMGYRGEIPELLGSLPVVRPLLGVWRAETEAYCRENGIQYVQDESNRDMRYFRNRLRLEVIPYLETINPRFKESLWRTSQILSGDEDALKDVLDERVSADVMRLDKDYSALKFDYWLSQPVGIQRRAVRHAVEHLRPGLRDVDFDSVERVLDFFKHPSVSGRQEWLAGLVLDRQGQWVILREGYAQVLLIDYPQIEGIPVPLSIPGEVQLRGSWKITSEERDADANILQLAMRNCDSQVAYLNGAKLHRPLSVRGFLPGDRFEPLGMAERSIKISNYFTNLKIPRPARSGIPLVFSGNDVVWVAGLRTAESTRVREDTHQIVVLRLIHNNGIGGISEILQEE